MGKILSFIYGLIAYIISVITFLYTIGFVGNLVVPKSIDSGTESTFLTAFLVDVILLSIFAAQHSLMARPAFKKWISTLISPEIERSNYILLSSAALLLICWQWQPITAVVWKTENETISMIITGLFFLGWLIVVLSTFMINHFEFFGLKQIFENLMNQQAGSPKFQTNFLYKIIRHPIMLGFVIAFWATSLMTVGHLIFSVTTTLYAIVAVKYLEEKDLLKLIGKEYQDYQNRVPMIIPFTKRKK
jgi:methanethiol S-methyltransferase